MKVNETLIGKIFWARCEEGEEKEKYDKMRDEWSKKSDTELIEKDLLEFINSNIKDKDHSLSSSNNIYNNNNMIYLSK